VLHRDAKTPEKVGLKELHKMLFDKLNYWLLTKDCSIE
jgi:hypothetical protein